VYCSHPWGLAAMCNGLFARSNPSRRGNGDHLKQVSYKRWFFFFCATAPSGPGPPHSRGFLITHNDASQSVGLLWTSDQPVAETSTWQHTTLTTNIHATGVIRTHNLSRRAVADLRLRPRGHWDGYKRWRLQLISHLLTNIFTYVNKLRLFLSLVISFQKP
jgi:hypothetical protein